MDLTSALNGDGCTLFPQGDWRHCCEVHDLAYAIGGDKLQIDLDMALCVAQTGHWLVAAIMFAGVSIFGGIWWAKARLCPPPPPPTEL